MNPNTPAQRAGLRPDDVILRFGGARVNSRNELIDQLWSTRPGQRVRLEINREGKDLSLQVVVGGIATDVPGSPEYKPRPRREPEDREPSPPEKEEATPPEDEPQGNKPEGAEEGGDGPDESEDQQPPPSGEEEQKPPPADTQEEPDDSGGAADPARGANLLAELGVQLDPVAIRCVVSSVRAGSPADTAGIKPGDVIVAIAGREAGDAVQAARSLARVDRQEAVEFTVERSGRSLDLRVVAPAE